MRKEKLKAKFKSNPSVPSRETSRPQDVSSKHNKQMAHHAPVRRSASKGRGFRATVPQPQSGAKNDVAALPSSIDSEEVGEMPRV